MEISEDEFIKLKPKEQMLVIFKNTNSISRDVSRFRFHQKVQYLSIGALFAVLGWLVSKTIT